MAKTPEEDKYFIVEQSQLSSYGSESGSDKEEAERLLAEAGVAIGDLVVIKGRLITPKFVL